jgi:hypothetical protein
VASGRRTAILETAAGRIYERGYHNTSMEDIADSVGLRKPTLYHYFNGSTRAGSAPPSRSPRASGACHERHLRRRSADIHPTEVMT